MRRDIRAFRVSGMKNLVTTDEVFIRRPLADVKEEEPAAVSRKYVTLKLRFQPEDLYRVYDDSEEGVLFATQTGPTTLPSLSRRMSGCRAISCPLVAMWRYSSRKVSASSITPSGQSSISRPTWRSEMSTPVDELQ